MAAPAVPPGWPRLSGGVFIEPAAVGPLARLLSSESRHQWSVNGARLVAPLQRLLEALMEEAKAQPLPEVRWISTAAAAEILGVSPQSVRNLIKAGQLVGRPEGRSWLVEEASVDSRASLCALPAQSAKDQVRRGSQSVAKLRAG